VAGDWDGDGIDDVGVFRPGATGRFFLRQPFEVTVPFPHTIVLTINFPFGAAGDQPVAGDWDGNGGETVGVYRPGDPGTFLLSNSLSDDIDFNFTFGGPGDLPVAGDWLALGRDGVGIFIPGIPVMLLTPELSSKAAFAFTFGQPGDVPVAGSFAP
jgi:hypothetical protein